MQIQVKQSYKGQNISSLYRFPFVYSKRPNIGPADYWSLTLVCQADHEKRRRRIYRHPYETFMMCRFLNVSYLSLDAEDIVIRRTEPDPNSQEFPCPHQRIQYECTTLRPVATLTWILPSGVGLGFTGASSVGRVRNSSDDQYSATLTSKMEDEDPDSDDLFITSTLLIIDPANGSDIICSGGTASGTDFEGNITVVLSGEYCVAAILVSGDEKLPLSRSLTSQNTCTIYCRHTRPSY